jgi:hypothetical protein
MPKTDIDYSNTIIYKITCKDTSITDVYVGHTTNFVQRKHGHKQSCINVKNNNHNCKLYQVIRANGGWNNWKMEIVNFFDCKDHYEARKKEQEYFESLKATLNSIEPFPKPKIILKPDLLTIKVKNEKLHCNVCDVIFNNNKAFEQHNSTNKHKKKTELALIISDEINESKYNCKPCKFSTNNKKDYDKHLLTEKHIKNIKIFEAKQHIEKKHHFTCDCCKYKCYKNSEFIKHLLTTKHIRNASGNTKNINDGYVCKICDKKYNSRKGLWGHSKTCKPMTNIEPKENIIIQIPNSCEEIHNMANILNELMKNNMDLQLKMSEFIKNNIN